MELSIIIPTPRIRPEREIILIVRPARWKKRILISTEAGILIPISHGDLPSVRKKNITRNAMDPPTSRLVFRFAMEKSSIRV